MIVRSFPRNCREAYRVIRHGTASRAHLGDDAAPARGRRHPDASPRTERNGCSRESLENHVRAGCSATRGAFCRVVTRAVCSPLSTVEPGSHPPIIFDSASTSSTHGCPNVSTSSGATLALYCLSPRPSPRYGLAHHAPWPQLFPPARASSSDARLAQPSNLREEMRLIAAASSMNRGFLTTWH